MTFNVARAAQFIKFIYYVFHTSALSDNNQEEKLCAGGCEAHKNNIEGKEMTNAQNV